MLQVKHYPFQFNRQFFFLQIRAAEISTTEQYSNTTTVILTIVDMNDNSPVFLPNQTTDVEVTEHETLGVVLATFSATDDDTGDYGTVEYYLEDGLGKFDMGRQSVGKLSHNLLKKKKNAAEIPVAVSLEVLIFFFFI